MRWMIKPKIVDGQHSTKARLSARGFEELQCFRTDSPACSREGIRITLATMASHKWQLQSLDIKTAFLQGKQIQRNVFLLPPKEANTDNLWHLKKCVYGLADASRYWFLRVNEKLTKLNGHVCPADQGIFMWHHNNQLIGIITCSVDAIIWSGTQYFYKTVIEKFKTTFKIGSESLEAFPCLGLNIKQNADFSIDVDQTNYVNVINPTMLTNDRMKNTSSPLTNKERSQNRQLIGQLNWITNMTKPEFSFEMCYANTIVNSVTIPDITKLNKVLKHIKSEKSYIKFSSLNIDSLSIRIYTKRKFQQPSQWRKSRWKNNICHSNENQSCPLAWNSSKIKCIVRSTLAAETLSMTDGCNISFFTTKIVNHIFQQHNINNTVITDNKSLLDCVQSTKLISDKRVRVELHALGQMYEKNEIETIWIPTNKQISNVLTKRGTARNQLTSILETGKLPSLS